MLIVHDTEYMIICLSANVSTFCTSFFDLHYYINISSQIVSNSFNNANGKKFDPW